MTNNSILVPTSEDAVSFREAVKAGFTKRNVLSPAYLIDFDPDVREKVLSHKFYKWLASERNFQKVLNYLSAKNLEGEFPDRRKIEIAHCVAIVYPQYCFYSAHPELLTKTTKATSAKAVKHINALLELLQGELQFERFSDNEDFERLLKKLKYEVSGKLPTTYPRSGRGNMLGARLVQDLHFFINSFIGVAPTFVVRNLVSLMVDVSAQDVRRYTESNQLKAKNGL